MMNFVNALTEEAWEELKCINCRMYLSVKPIGILQDGTMVCGRCYSKINCDGNRTEPIRAVTLENFLSKVLIPCTNFLNGCKRMLKLETCQNHEDNCSFKKYPCLALERDSCIWNGTGPELLEHCRSEHSDLMITDDQFELQLDHNGERSRMLLYMDRFLFLVKTKICPEKNILYCCVKFLGSPRHAEEYTYSLEFSDPSNNSSFISAVHTKENRVESNQILSMNLSSAIEVNINEILCQIGFSKTVRCGIKIQHGEQRRSTTPELPDVLVQCLWPGCHSVITLKDLQNHEKSCPNRASTCKWSGCDQVCLGDDIHQHHDVCENRIHSCRWDGCTDLLPFKHIDDHEEMCEKRLTTFYDCDVVNGTGPCEAHLSLTDFIPHIRNVHPTFFYESFEVERIEALWSGNHFFMLAYGEFFRCKCTFACGIDGFKFEALCYGTDKRSRDFRLEVEMVHPNDPEKNLRLHSEIVSYNSKVSKYAHVESIRPIRHYIQHNKIKFLFRILKHV